MTEQSKEDQLLSLLNQTLGFLEGVAILSGNEDIKANAERYIAKIKEQAA